MTKKEVRKVLEAESQVLECIHYDGMSTDDFTPEEYVELVHDFICHKEFKYKKRRK